MPNADLGLADIAERICGTATRQIDKPEVAG